MQHLNCAKGQASTDSVINDAEAYKDIFILFLQELWTDGNRKIPPSQNYIDFTPTGTFPKCGPYIRIDLDLKVRNITRYANHSLKITIIINDTNIDLMNIYTPRRARPIADLLPTLKQAHNAYLDGDWNANHVW